MDVRRKIFIAIPVLGILAALFLLGTALIQASHPASVTLKNKATGSTQWTTSQTTVTDANVVQVIINDANRNQSPSTTENFQVTIQNPTLGSSTTVTVTESNASLCGMPDNIVPPNSPCFLGQVTVVQANPGAGQIVGFHGHTLQVNYTPAGDPAHSPIPASIIVDTGKPTISDTLPSNNATISGPTVTFAGHVTDGGPAGFPTNAGQLTPDHLRVEIYSQDGSSLIQTLGPAQMSLAAVSGGWSFTAIAALATGEYRWQVVAQDQAGNLARSDSDTGEPGDQRFRLTVQAPEKSLGMKNKGTGSTQWVTNDGAISNTNILQVIIRDAHRNTSSSQVDSFQVTVQNVNLGASVQLTATEVSGEVCGLPANVLPPNSPCFLAEVVIVPASPQAGQLVGLHGNTLKVDYTPAGTPTPGTLSASMTVDTVKPVFTALQPANNQSVNGPSVTFQGMITDADSGFPTTKSLLTQNHFKVDVYAQDGATLLHTFAPSDMELDSIANGWEFKVKVNLAAGDYRWQVTAKDRAGNQARSDADGSTSGEQKFAFRVTTGTPTPTPTPTPPPPPQRGSKLPLAFVLLALGNLDELVRAEFTVMRDNQLVTFTAIAGTVTGKSGETLTIQPKDGSSTFTQQVPQGTPIVQEFHSVGLDAVDVNDEVVLLRENGALRLVLVEPFKHHPLFLPPGLLGHILGFPPGKFSLEIKNDKLELRIDGDHPGKGWHLGKEKGRDEDDDDD